MGWGDIICWGVNFFYRKPTFKKSSLINFVRENISALLHVLLQIDINSNHEVGILFLPYRKWQLLNWRMIERLLNWRINLHLKKWVCFIFTFLFFLLFYIYFFCWQCMCWSLKFWPVKVQASVYKSIPFEKDSLPSDYWD